MERHESAEQHGVVLNCTCDNAQVRAARVVLEQALSDLLENALNYGTSNPDPRIDVACSLRRDEVRISVTDNGKGIAPRHHERVFEIFRRLDPDAADGSGVGLVTVPHPMPDVVLLDERMPRMDGSDVLEALHAHGGAERVPLPIICHMTFGTNPKLVSQCYALGATFCVAKPMNYEAMVEKLSIMMRFFTTVLELPQTTTGRR